MRYEPRQGLTHRFGADDDAPPAPVVPSFPLLSHSRRCCSHSSRPVATVCDMNHRGEKEEREQRKTGQGTHEPMDHPSSTHPPTPVDVSRVRGRGGGRRRGAHARRAAPRKHGRGPWWQWLLLAVRHWPRRCLECVGSEHLLPMIVSADPAAGSKQHRRPSPLDVPLPPRPPPLLWGLLWGHGSLVKQSSLLQCFDFIIGTNL